MITSINEFKKTIWQNYTTQGRIFDWRHADDPYKIFVSEVMLQQTQTQRVTQKYIQWITVFPDFKTLAQASLKDVLAQWQGLGYNRRGLFLHKAAQIIASEYYGNLPNDREILEGLPGIGKATAASIRAFAFNEPTVFIETNIRTVFIYFFFPSRDNVHDNEVMPLVMQTVDPKNPREWYYALMDYGVMLKKRFKNPSRKSIHHHQQSKFEGSDRQIRGMILKILTAADEPIDEKKLTDIIGKDHVRVKKIIDQLVDEKFIGRRGDTVSIA